LDGEGDGGRFERFGVVEEDEFGLFFDVGEDFFKRGIFFLQRDLAVRCGADLGEGNGQEQGSPSHDRLVNSRGFEWHFY
jgi:hypothetical protein